MEHTVRDPFGREEELFKVICNGCGYCCLKIPCIYAQAAYDLKKGDGKQCPELYKTDSRRRPYRCRLMEGDITIGPGATFRDALMLCVRLAMLNTGCEFPNEKAVGQ